MRKQVFVRRHSLARLGPRFHHFALDYCASCHTAPRSFPRFSSMLAAAALLEVPDENVPVISFNSRATSLSPFCQLANGLSQHFARRSNAIAQHFVVCIFVSYIFPNCFFFFFAFSLAEEAARLGLFPGYKDSTTMSVNVPWALLTPFLEQNISYFVLSFYTLPGAEYFQLCNEP